VKNHLFLMSSGLNTIMFCVPRNIAQNTRPALSLEFAAFLRHWEVLSPDLRDQSACCDYLFSNSDSIWAVLDVISDPTISESVLLACVGSLKTWYSCHWSQIPPAGQRAVVHRLSSSVLIERHGFCHLLNAFAYVASPHEFHDIWSTLISHLEPLLTHNRIAGLAIIRRGAAFFYNFPVGFSDVPDFIITIASYDRRRDPFTDRNATLIRFSIKAAVPLLFKRILDTNMIPDQRVWDEMAAWCQFMTQFLGAIERADQPSHWRLIKSVGRLFMHISAPCLLSELPQMQPLRQWIDATMPLLMACAVQVFARQFEGNEFHESVVKALFRPVAKFVTLTEEMSVQEIFGWVHAFAAISATDQLEFEEQPATYYATVFYPRDDTLLGLALRFVRQLCQHASPAILFDILQSHPITDQSARVLSQIAPHFTATTFLSDALSAWIKKFLQSCQTPRLISSLFFLAAKANGSITDSDLARELFSAAAHFISASDALVGITTASKLLLLFPVVPELAEHLPALARAVLAGISAAPLRLSIALLPHSSSARELCAELLPFCIAAATAELERGADRPTRLSPACLDFCGAAVSIIGDCQFSEHTLKLVALALEHIDLPGVIESAIALSSRYVESNSLFADQHIELLAGALPDLMDFPLTISTFFCRAIETNGRRLSVGLWEAFSRALAGANNPDAVQIAALVIPMALLLVADPALSPDIGDLIATLIGSRGALQELVGFNLLAAFCLHRSAELAGDAISAWVAFVRARRVCTEHDARIHCEALARVGGGVGEEVAAEMTRDLEAFIGRPEEMFGDEIVANELVLLGG
jgi:hypothetical protein